MRHKKDGRKLGRDSAHRKALMRNLAKALFIYKRIETTDAKAKELRRFAEKLITRAKKGRVHDIRILNAKLGNAKDVVHELVHEIAPKFQNRNGGYTRIVKVRNRRGDNAPMSIIELVDFFDEPVEENA